MMALGTHRPMTENEIREKVGSDIISRISVMNSEFHDKNKLTYMGTGADEVPLWIDSRVMEADLKIGIGTIFPHPAAGWGGGTKIVYPGVSGEDTVRFLHLMQGATPRNLFGDDNSPIRTAIEAWTAVIGLDFIVNVIFTPQQQVYRVVAGHFIKAHRQGVKFSKAVYGVKAKAKADIVIISSYPADLDMWQATKALCSGEHLVKDGGILILVTPCPEGVGPHQELAEYMGEKNPDVLLDRVRSGKIAEPICASGIATIARMRDHVSFGLISDGLNSDAAAQMKMHYYDSVQEAVDDNLRKYGKDARVSVIPYGAELFPHFGENANHAI